MDGGGGAPPPWRQHRATIAEVVRECWAQLGKVAWPSSRSLTTNSLLVILVLVVVILAVGALDLALGALKGA